MKKTGRLANRLTISFVLAVALPLVIVSLLFGWGFARFSQQAIQTRQSSIIEVGRAYINRYFNDLFDEVTLIGGFVDRGDPDWVSTVELICRRSADAYLSLSILDTNGDEISRLEDCRNTGMSSLSNRANEEAFFRAARGEIFVGNVSFNAESQPIATISLQTKARDGRQIVVIARVDLGNIWQPLNELEVSEGGYIYVVDQRGNLVGYRDPAVIKLERNLASSPSVAPLLVDQPGVNSARYTGLLGEDVIGTSSVIDQLNWGLVLEQPASQVYETRNQLAILFLVILVIFSIAAIRIALSNSRSIVTPIQQLAEGAEAIARDDLTVHLDVKSQDEIGVTAQAFNQMTSRLRDLIGSLEQRVADRTHDLELASEVGRAITERVGDLSDLLFRASETIRSRFDLYYTQIFLVDPAGLSLIMRAGTGDTGAQLLQRGHRLVISPASLNGRAALERTPLLVGDTQKSTNFLPNPLLPLTRSELTVPLIVNEKVVGVLDMQSAVPDAFSETNLPAFQVLAGQLAVTIQNSQLFDQAEEARHIVEEQAQRLTSAGWHEYMNAVDRQEKIGFAYNDSKTVALDDFNSPASEETLTVPITVSGASVGSIHITEENRAWTDDELGILEAVSTQLAQHLESLRLLNQADKYRLEAEQVTRRLTRESWNDYLNIRKNIVEGFTYSGNMVESLSGNNKENNTPAQSYPIRVRDEQVGELIVESTDGMDSDTAEIVSVITQQLSSHIENLRLLEESEISRNELHLGEVRLRSLIENAPEAIVVVDLTTGLFADPNENATKLYGLPREELVKVGPAQMSPPTQPDGRDSTEKAMEKINEAMQGGAPVFEWIHRNGQGVDFPCEVRLVRLPGELPQVRASVTDITQRKRDQEIIAQRANQLETVAAVSSTASTVLNPDLLLQQVVDLTKTRFNLYHAHIYLLDESWSTLLLAAGAGEVGKQMVTSGHTIAADAERSLVARAARERQAIIVNDVRNEQGFLPNLLLPETRSEMAVPMIVGDKVLGVLDVQSEQAGHFSQEDVTIQTTLAAQVAIALQNARLYVEQSATVTQLRELDRLKSSFLANMSHELRTPLNSILGFADVMLEELDGPLTPNMDNDLKLIQKNGQHLLHLINDVLDMAKIESGTLNLIIEKFNLQEVIEEATSITSSLANEKNIDLVIEEDSDHDVMISADRTRLRQVLINIVNNAMKFTEKGKIAVRAIKEENNILISVKDTGIGIPQSQLESVFQEFTQVDSSTTRKAGGTGLGLPISRRLIQLHGGRIWAESTGVPGEGATFYVFMPIEAKVSDSEPVQRSDQHD